MNLESPHDISGNSVYQRIRRARETFENVLEHAPCTRAGPSSRMGTVAQRGLQLVLTLLIVGSATRLWSGPLRGSTTGLRSHRAILAAPAVDSDIQTSVHTTSIVCDGQPFALTCPYGYVISQINTAFYGRSDSTHCPYTDLSAVKNTRCSLATIVDEMAKVCIGKATCNPPGSAKGYSSDPCPGTYKWSSATYTCTISRVNQFIVE